MKTLLYYDDESDKGMLFTGIVPKKKGEPDDYSHSKMIRLNKERISTIDKVVNLIIQEQKLYKEVYKREKTMISDDILLKEDEKNET